MKITYDEAKNVFNITKHGISLSDAQHIEWETLWFEPDARCNYGEERFIGWLRVHWCTVVLCGVYGPR
jgi:uncharacterized DUF497 family protein